MNFDEKRQPGYYWVIWTKPYGPVVGYYSGSGHWKVGARCLLEPELHSIGDHIPEPDKVKRNGNYIKDYIYR